MASAKRVQQKHFAQFMNIISVFTVFMSQAASQSDVIQRLRKRLLKAQHSPVTGPVVSSGIEQLDLLLPQRGLRPGSVLEFVAAAPGSSTAVVALHCVRQVLQQPGALAVVDPKHQFNCAAAVATGIPLERLLLIRPSHPDTDSHRTARSDILWALEQSVRCSGVRAVLCWLDRASSTVLRRLQLAVEASGVTVFLLRPASCLKLTSWADVRVQFNPESVDDSSFCGVTACVVQSRQAVEHHGVVSLRINHETGTLSSTSELARPALTCAERR